MDENQPNNKGFFIKIFIALIVLAFLICGYFYILKSDTPLLTENNQDSQLPKGFERDLENKLSTEFPKGLVVEKEVIPVESFSVKDTGNIQYTYRYITKLSADQNYQHFSKFLNINKWQEISNTKIGSNWFLTSSKQGQTLSISYSLNTLTKDTIVDIILSQKSNE